MSLRKLLVASVLMAAAGSAAAAPPTLAVNSPTSPVSQPQGTAASIVVTFTNSTAPDPTAAGFQFRLAYNNAVISFPDLSATNVISSPAGIVCNQFNATTLSCGGFASAGTFPASVTVTIRPATAASAGTSPLTMTNFLAFDGDGNPIAGATAGAAGTYTVTGGGGGGTAPTVTYNPTTAAGVTFPAGAAGTATSSITVTSAGGTAPGTVTVNNCSASAGFTITNGPINLTGTAGGAQINSSIALQCTRGGAVQNGTLSCTETPTPAVAGSPFTRTWNLTCPQATVANTPPTITYTPAAGSNINIPSNSSSTIQVGCPTDGAACNGSGSGLDATARLENITVAYNGPPFSPTPNDLTCTFVTEAGAAAGASLDFVPAQADSGDIRCSCTQVFTAEPYIVSVRERIPANSMNVTATRTFNVTCGAGLTCGSITATPAGGNVALNNGGAAVQVSSIAVANIPAGVTQTVNCALSAINGATFNVTTTPTPMVLSSTTTTGTVSATCNNASTTTAGTATLTCTSAGSAPGCPGLTATYNLSCPPGQAPPPPVELVPVPALGEQGRILLAALMLALGLVVVGFRLRG